MYLFYTFQLFVYKFTNTKENWVFHDYEFEMSFLFFSRRSKIPIIKRKPPTIHDFIQSEVVHRGRKNEKPKESETNQEKFNDTFEDFVNVHAELALKKKKNFNVEHNENPPSINNDLFTKDAEFRFEPQIPTGNENIFVEPTETVSTQTIDVIINNHANIRNKENHLEGNQRGMNPTNSDVDNSLPSTSSNVSMAVLPGYVNQIR